MIGNITRMMVDGSYVWGVVADNEFVECTRIFELIKKVDDTSALAGKKVEIIIK